jgi:hypothetical protein
METASLYEFFLRMIAFMMSRSSFADGRIRQQARAELGQRLDGPRIQPRLLADRYALAFDRAPGAPDVSLTFAQFEALSRAAHGHVRSGRDPRLRLRSHPFERLVDDSRARVFSF